ncbi:MAG TPA: Nif3-like dinuclear metal center hexameric protein [Firmicutes bacterium]|uniref:GTP cyclohydrolase 1 type 2 homolog n=1 Tax=Capillibacterium thermochitinicola TaxID=2699427 RepID=A0A8J6LI85_9FIRM|nr:Nif3-like dinuclear metal center hexameric protein [Capillibacterium thermochitinicola]MBA2132376.1 Nif3-like dinuclear metal center hexameric protein [Capillibacterium thermochitinicola]HHW12449.1 Nif3-like dinuclear metal center hexameric protein [Bacillota bacterium]
MPTVREITSILEELAPLALAESWDNVGLQVGRFDREVTGLLLALDFSAAVLAEARQKQANLIVTHHPLIFKPLNNLQFDRPGGEVWEEMIAGGFVVYAMHTNFDRAADGLNQYLAELLQLSQVEPVEEGAEEHLKLVVYVPEDHVEPVFAALTAAGAGWIGNYSHCTFRTSGVGTFLPRDGANPFFGEVGAVSSVPEVRLETIIPARKRESIIKAMLAAHPYEEVAYDLYPVVQKGGRAGLGRVGRLPKPQPFSGFLAEVKTLFNDETLRWGGFPRETVSKIAVIGGSGGKYLGQAKRKGAEVLITSDLGYHDFLHAEQLGMTIVEVGHHTIEAVGLKRIKEYLEKDQSLTPEFKARIYLSEHYIKPYSFY